METPMYRKEYRIIISLIASVLILAGYSLYLYRHYFLVNPELLNDFRFWGKSFLVMIPIAIVAQIVIHIIYFIVQAIITRAEISDLEDERDKLIELKAIKISHWVFVSGFLLAMGSQAIGMAPWIMFAVLIFSGFFASIAEGIAQIYFYRKGF